MKSSSVDQEWQLSTVHNSPCLCLKEQTELRKEAKVLRAER